MFAKAWLTLEKEVHGTAHVRSDRLCPNGSCGLFVFVDEMWKIRQQTRSRNNVEQKVEAKTHRHWVHQRKCHHYHDPGEPRTHQIDECVLSPLKVCGPPHWDDLQKQSRNTWRFVINTFQSLDETSMLNWDLEKERNVKVCAGTVSTRVTKEVIGWKVGWCYMFTLFLNTMFRRTPQKRTTFVAPQGKEKQIDYILTKRRYLRHAKDAEANDMLHLGIDHRCVMAIFMITMFGKNIHIKDKKKNKTRLSMMNATKQKKHQYWNARARKKMPRKRWH